MQYNLIEKELRSISLGVRENFNTNLKEKDKSFKVLFEVKDQFIQLLKTYIKDDWVKETRKGNIELVDKEFTTINLEERRADVVYKIKLKQQEIYFFLLEFQSSVDKMMPFRLYEYMLELYRKYKQSDKLPMVIPCVLYTGNTKWNVGDMKTLFNVRKELERYIPNFEYILIDVNNYTDEELIKTSNLISSVFFLSKSKDEFDVIDRINKLLKMVKKLKPEEQKSLTKWAKTMFIKKPQVQYYLDENLENEEENDMGNLAELIPGAIEIWERRCRDEGYSLGKNDGYYLGKNEGYNAGWQEAEQKAKVSSLLRLLAKKLNSEPTKKIISKIENSTAEEIEKIEDKIFEITSWKEVEEIVGK